MKKKVIFISFLLLVLSAIHLPWCQASSEDVGTCGAQFLKIGVGGRAMAMGGAFVGLSDDASGIYWNPAGLANMNKTEALFMHLVWFQDISYEYFACAKPDGKSGTTGLGIGYLHMGKLQGRDQEGNPTSDFTSSDMLITISHGHNLLNSGVSLGGSVKYINEKIKDKNVYAFAFDLGCIYQTPLEGLRLGGLVQNLGQKIKFVKESDKLPTLFKLGVSYSRNLMQSPVNLAMDIYSPSDGRMSLHLGAECIYENTFIGRIGYKNLSQSTESNLSLGFGLMLTKVQTFSVDYAFLSQGVLGNTHTISLGVRF